MSHLARPPRAALATHGHALRQPPTLRHLPTLRLLAALTLLLLVTTGCGTEADAGTSAASADGASADGVSGVDGASGADGSAGADSGASSDAGATDSGATAGGPPYAIGVRTITVAGAGGRDLPTEVWYPIAAGTKGAHAKYLLDQVPSPYGAIRDAKPLTGNLPLVVFSHGNGGVREQSVFLTEWLARHGYVVASPEHVGNSFLSMKQEQTAVMTLWRPQDVTAVIDTMLTPGKDDPAFLQGLADPERVGVTGHSFGGYTSLAVAGLKVQVPPAYNLDCSKAQAERSPQDQLVCPEIAKLGAAPFSFHDKRVKVAVPLAHAGYGWKMLVKVAKDAKHIPLVILGASGDTLTPFATEAQPLYDDLTTPSALIKIVGGSHYSFANLCDVEHLLPAGFKQNMGNICTASAKPTIAETFDIVQTYTLAAMDLVLRGDSDAAQVFDPKKETQGLHTLQSRGLAQ